jgi:NADPH:quinone reductase-like Zn-dependent oxidoreductase
MSIIPKTMSAVLTTGHGGYEMLEFRKDIKVPSPDSDQVLIKVLGAGINNTDINTRTAWYSKSVKGETNANHSQGEDGDGSWSGEPLEFPIIQGADCYGEIVAVGDNVDAGRIGERVLVRTMQQYAVDYRPYECWTMGSECDGAFAQYMVAFSDESFKIESNWSNAELASIPCAYSTAENLLERSDVKEGEVVLITGASGGVGSAAIMLAKRRGARVVAVASEAKARMVQEIGADEVIHREDKLIDSIDNESIDVVIDLVAGESWGELLEVLKKGGRYAASGAIAGPIVELDVRTLYLKDLVLIGCTFQDRQVFQNLIGYIERNEIKPLVSKTYPLRGIVNAQKDFVSKKYVGKLVLLP